MEGVSLGQHLNPPEGCPEVIKSLMLSCWELIPNDRISFSKIVETLSEDNLKSSMSNPNYMNAKLCPLDYKSKYRLSLSNQVEKRNEDLIKNINIKRTANSSSWHMSTNNVPLNSKHSCSPLLDESPETQENPSVTTETQYTVILASTEDLED